MHKTGFFNQKFLMLISVIFIVLVLGFSFIEKINTHANDGSKPKITSAKNDPLLKSGCTRKRRLDNLPQYDRALSLIQQRLIVNLERFKYNNRAIFTFFPPELTNCIKVVEEISNQLNGFEGYFKFNGNDIKSDYYPIVVNSKYIESDDVLIALLLTHEITHVQQYLNSINNIKTFSCVDGEVGAFLASQQFYITGLNDEENRSITNRIYEALDNKKTGWSLKYPNPFDGQLLMLYAIGDLSNSPLSKCKSPEHNTTNQAFFEDVDRWADCTDLEKPNLLKKILEKDSYYKKQCKL